MMIKKWMKLKTKDIVLVQFFIEGYEGLATVSTIEPRTAIIQIEIMPDFLPDFIDILESLKNKFFMEEIPYANADPYISVAKNHGRCRCK